MIRAGVRRVLHLALPRRDRWEREVDEEIALHLALRTEQLIAEGRSAPAARAEALRQFGSLDEARARLREAARRREQHLQQVEYIADVRQDVRFALRSMRRQKAWTAITMSTLALGIGAVTAVFSVVSSLLIHAIPYPAADRVVVVQQQPTHRNNTGVGVSIAPETRIVNAWRANAHSFEVLEPYHSIGLLLRTNGDPVPVRGTQILSSFAAFAGVQPILGRLFSSEEIASHARVALLAEGLWRERYGADPAVIGRTVAFGDSAFVIVGVMPASLTLPGAGRDRTDFWLPLDVHDAQMSVNVVGRLRPGAKMPAATRELDALALASGVYGSARAPFVTVIRRPAELVEFHDSLILLTGAVGLVLLVACANVAHLVLARGATRARELAVRAALGAGRARLVRQLLTEALVLASAGAAAGILLGWLALHGMLAVRPSTMAELGHVHLDATTVCVAIAAALLNGVLFGSVAAFQAARRSANETLKAGARGASSGRRHDRFRALLVTSEMAVSATLIVGAALLVRTVINLQHADLGFDPHDLYWTAISLPTSKVDSGAARAAFFTELTAQLRAAPHVRAVTIATVPPGSRAFSVGRFEIEGETPSPSAADASSFTDVNAIDHDFFTTMGIPLVEGTMFTDTSEAAGQVIVNASFARAHWPAGGALGKRVRVADVTGQGSWLTIVGVAGDAQTTGAGLVSTAPFLYTPLGRSGRQQAVMIRSDAPIEVARTIRAIAKRIDPSVPTPQVESVEEYVQRSIARPRFTMALLTAFTILALILAAVGLYGMMAYAVTERTREFGIRMALGAPSGRIARTVVQRGIGLALVGAALGLAGAYGSTRLIAGSLYGVAPLDALSFTVGAAVLIATAVVACIVPARRALAVDPMTAIRTE